MTSDLSRFSVGYGRDIHRLFPQRTLVLGGVDVSTEIGFDTHSDGDVLCHAIIDAIAGAMADGDLGTHYPEDDPDAEDARSLDFVIEFSKYMADKGFELINLDSFVTLGTVRLRPHIEQMRANIADAIGVDPKSISVKARSNDGIGPEGEGTAASASVIVLLRRMV